MMKGKEHANLLAIFAYVFSGIQGLITFFFGAYLLLMGGLTLSAALSNRSGDAGGFIMMLVVVAIFGVFFALGLACIIRNVQMGRRLRSGRPPTQRSVMITSIMNCCALLFGGMFSMPFGVAIGVYGIWFANSEIGKRYFSGQPDPEPMYINPPAAQANAQAPTPQNQPYKWQ